MKRRKPKSSAETPPSNDPGQSPLQPAYFDEPAPPAETAAEEEGVVDLPAAEQARPEPVPSEISDSQSQPAQGGSEAPSRRRRRRGRGGRGRGKAQKPLAPLQPTLTPAEESPAAPTTAPSQAPPPPLPRISKGAVILAIGLPGSGKSSWFKRHNVSPLSSDLLRSLLFDDPTEQRFQDLVFSNLRSMLKARLIARRPMNYVDATNLSPHERHAWIKMARDYGYEVHAVFFDVPVEVCMERNQRRNRVVPDDVMQRMAAKLRAPSFDEGFAKITVVRVKKKD